MIKIGANLQQDHVKRIEKYSTMGKRENFSKFFPFASSWQIFC
jgi:hypothetical protein